MECRNKAVIDKLISGYSAKNVTEINSSEIIRISIVHAFDDDDTDYLNDCLYANGIETIEEPDDDNDNDFDVPPDKNRDHLKDYFKQIRAYKPLSKEEEYKIAKTLKTIREKYPDKKLTEYSEKDKTAYKRAKNMMIMGNLRLVVKIAKKYHFGGAMLMDLIQAGNTGLSKACDRYDPDRESKNGGPVTFASCASQWIRQCVVRELNRSIHTIKLPQWVQEAIPKINIAVSEYENKHGTAPTNKQLSEILGMPEKKLIEIEILRMNTISLDTTIGEDANTQIGDTIADSNAKDPTDFINIEYKRETLEKVAACLPASLRDTFRLSHGLTADGIEKNIEEISEILNLNQNTVKHKLKDIENLCQMPAIKELLDSLK